MDICYVKDKSDSAKSDDFKLVLSDEEKIICEEDDLRLFLSDDEVPITDDVELENKMEAVEKPNSAEELSAIVKEEITVMKTEIEYSDSKDHEEPCVNKRLAEDIDGVSSKKPRRDDEPTTPVSQPADPLPSNDPVTPAAQTPDNSAKNTTGVDEGSEEGPKEDGDDDTDVRPMSPEPLANTCEKTPEEIRQEAEIKARKKKVRENVRKVLNRDYKNMSKKDFEDIIVVAVMDYFRHYNPTIQLQKKVIMLERLVMKLKENYDRTVKQLYESKYLIKRMIEMKKESTNSPMEIPFKLIRSVAVQVHSTRCRGGDLCPGVPALPNHPKEMNGGTTNTAVKRSSRKSTNQRPVVRETEKTSNIPSNQPTVNGEVPSTSTKSTVQSATPAKSAVVPLVPATAQVVATKQQQVQSPKDPPSKATAVVIDLTSKDDPVENGSKDKLPAKPTPPVNNYTSDLVKKMPVGVPIPPGHKVVSIEKVQLPQLPTVPKYPAYTTRPPQPVLKVNKADQSGIMLSWTLKNNQPLATEISSYQVYACQENCGIAREWSPVGDVKALPLPMACTLSQFREGHRYHFVVRAVDKHRVLGDFSHPASILLVKGVAPR